MPKNTNRETERTIPKAGEIVKAMAVRDRIHQYRRLIEIIDEQIRIGAKDVLEMTKARTEVALALEHTEKTYSKYVDSSEKRNILKK